MFLEKIGLENIEIGLKAKDWEEAIRLSSRKLLEDKKIQERYVEAMINSVKEHGPYIVLTNHVALAHARPEDGVNEMGLHFVTLDPSIEFGNEDFDPVKLLIVLAAKDSESHLDLLGELADILSEDDSIDKLASAQTKEEFKKVLIGE